MLINQGIPMSQKVKKALRELQSRLIKNVDDRLESIRSEYEELDDPRKKELKLWLASVSETERAPINGLTILLRAEILLPDGEETTPVRFRPSTLLAAASAWDLGKEYIPHAFADL
jgi:hypothetical protein